MDAIEQSLKAANFLSSFYIVRCEEFARDVFSPYFKRTKKNNISILASSHLDVDYTTSSEQVMCLAYPAKT